LTHKSWDSVAETLRSNKGKLGDLGGGNHFLDALVSLNSGTLYFLIHTGSRNESGIVDDLIGKPAEFDTEFSRVVEWAKKNRAAVQKAIENMFGTTEIVLDMPHNSFEKQNNGGVIIRKGAVKVKPGEMAVIPSHMTGDVLLVKAADRISETLFSMSHGKGRKVSRSEAKNLITPKDIETIKQKIMLPHQFNIQSLRTEGPQAYRNLDDCLILIGDYVSVVERFKVIAYMGHL
jgi:RNA-splicing ligase RtcB